ncbi:MAG: NAD(P)H-dependent oxidoreductase subunit E [Bryobacteraceae bacterium]|jgi:NADH:ubiquinone oxidoreductase subunit E
MTGDRQPSIARTGSWIAGWLVALCVAILLTDYVVASRRAPGDDKLIKELQQQTKSDASLAPRLAAEQKRVTAARRARKSRDNAVAWALIAAASAFIGFAKRQIGKEKPAAPAAHGNERKSATRGVRPTLAAAELDLTFVDRMVSEIGRGREAAIPLLQAIQAHYRYLPDEALRRLCELTEITPAEVAGTSSFYARFRRSPVGEHIVRVCHGTACHVSGARQITEELRRYLAIPDGEDTDAARLFTLDEVACLGCCSLAPVLMVDEHTAGKLTPASACDALKLGEGKELTA